MTDSTGEKHRPARTPIAVMQVICNSARDRVQTLLKGQARFSVSNKIDGALKLFLSTPNQDGMSTMTIVPEGEAQFKITAVEGPQTALEPYCQGGIYTLRELDTLVHGFVEYSFKNPGTPKVVAEVVKKEKAPKATQGDSVADAVGALLNG